jgi:hypothetical protein
VSSLNFEGFWFASANVSMSPFLLTTIFAVVLPPGGEAPVPLLSLSSFFGTLVVTKTHFSGSLLDILVASSWYLIHEDV